MQTAGNGSVRKSLFSPQNHDFRREIVKLAFVFALLFTVGGIFFINPTLSTPTLLSIVMTILISPFVTFFERQGISRLWSILLMFLIIALAFASGGVWITNTIMEEWDSFQAKVPVLFEKTVERVEQIEVAYQMKYPFLDSIHPAESLVTWGKSTGTWFITKTPGILGDLLTWLLIMPILTFVMLRDGRAIRKRFFELVPNRFFESTFMVSSRITASLADYIRAKLFEAMLVGTLTVAGLTAVGAPYAVVFGIIAGVTNIIPYAGPLMGAAPGVLVAMFDPSAAEILWPIVIVYASVNMIDLFFIFPVVVAKLVDLHPILLLTAVILGEQYYGLIGMLISIPIATTLKIIVQEMYFVVYQPAQSRVDFDVA